MNTSDYEKVRSVEEQKEWFRLKDMAQDETTALLAEELVGWGITTQHLAEGFKTAASKMVDTLEAEAKGQGLEGREIADYVDTEMYNWHNYKDSLRFNFAWDQLRYHELRFMGDNPDYTELDYRRELAERKNAIDAELENSNDW